MVETAGKQQTEGVNGVISELLGTFLQKQHISQQKPREAFLLFYWNVKYGPNQHRVFERRWLDSSGEHSPSSLLDPVSPGAALAAQTEHPLPRRGQDPAPRPPWSSFSSMAIEEGRGLNSSLSLTGVSIELVCLRASSRRAAAPGGSRLCSCRWITGCQAAGSECPRRGCDKRQATVPSFPPRLPGSNLLLLENGSRALYLIPGPGGWSLGKGSCFVGRWLVKE